MIFFFFFSTGISRFAAVQSGLADWVRVNYTYNIFSLNNEKATLALNMFFLGSLVLSLSLIYFQRRIRPINETLDNQELFIVFIRSKTQFIIILFVFFILLNSVFSGLRSGSAALGNSYFLLFAMALGGLIPLMFILYKNLSMTESLGLKILLIGLLAYSIVLSYNPSQRFRFLSWMIVVGTVYVGSKTSIQKLKYYLVGGVLVILFFSLAGVARKTDLSQLSIEEMISASLDRYEETDDQNMLDGFMMVLDVYPEHLGFHYGMEHLEILMRPIPRSLWPSKPLGGYVNKLGLNDVEQGTVGISQTIYGTFYGEGGVPGIIIFSVMYGWLFIKAFRYADRYNSDMRWLIKGIILAWALPWLRGGDIPGIVAWFGMSFWPVFLILRQYNAFIERNKYAVRIS